MKIKLSCLIVSLIPFQRIKQLIYSKCFGFKIGKKVKIGFSYIEAREAVIDNDVVIEHLNVFKGINSLYIGKGTVIHRNNLFSGETKLPGTVCKLYIGEHSTIGVGHYMDLTDEIHIKNNVVFAGRKTEVWTHGFDILRQRIQAPVYVGNNCYIGSGTKINLGVEISDNVIVGMGSVVSKSLLEEGFYAGGPAKKIHSKVVFCEDSQHKVICKEDNTIFFKKIK